MEKKPGRPCRKSYDPMAVMEKLLSTVDAVFEEKKEIKATAAELDLAELKVRKLLITSGKLRYPVTEQMIGRTSGRYIHCILCTEKESYSCSLFKL